MSICCVKREIDHKHSHIHVSSAVRHFQLQYYRVGVARPKELHTCTMETIHSHMHTTIDTGYINIYIERERET